MGEDSSAQRSKKKTTDKRALADMYQRDLPPLRPPPQLLQRERVEFGDLDVPRRAPLSNNAASARPASPRPMPAREMLRADREDTAPRYSPIAEAKAKLHYAELSATRGSQVHSYPAVTARGSFGSSQTQPWVLGIIAFVSIVVIAFYLFLSQPKTTISGFRMPASEPYVAEAQPEQPPAANGEHSILGVPTVSAERVDAVLQEYGSPATGTGRVWVELGKKYNIDPAYALAFFIHESSAATAPAWAGWKPDGSSTHNIGNIICAGYPTCYGRFRDYASWEEGIEDWYELIAVEYVNGRGVHTVEQIIPIYAPAFENDVPAYVNGVENMVNKWRSGDNK
jgi:hypothetical protein